jgi:hypothetical protein
MCQVLCEKSASGFGLREEKSRQPTADRERIGIQVTGFGLREGFIEKWKGDPPSPLIPFDRLTTPLSLGGARKIMETGYHRPQGGTAERRLPLINDFTYLLFTTGKIQD